MMPVTLLKFSISKMMLIMLITFQTWAVKSTSWDSLENKQWKPLLVQQLWPVCKRGNHSSVIWKFHWSSLFKSNVTHKKQLKTNIFTVIVTNIVRFVPLLAFAIMFQLYGTNKHQSMTKACQYHFVYYQY